MSKKALLVFCVFAFFVLCVTENLSSAWNEKFTEITFEKLKNIISDAEPVAFVPFFKTFPSSRIKFGVSFSSFVGINFLEISQSIVYETNSGYGAINFILNRDSIGVIEVTLHEPNRFTKKQFTSEKFLPKTIHAFEFDIRNKILKLISEDAVSASVILQTTTQDVSFVRVLAFTVNFQFASLDCVNLQPFIPKLELTLFGIYQTTDLIYRAENCTVYNASQIQKLPIYNNNIEVWCYNEHEVFPNSCLIPIH